MSGNWKGIYGRALRALPNGYLKILSSNIYRVNTRFKGKKILDMAKRTKAELEEIEQRIYSAKTEQEKKWWKLILERLKNNPPPKPIKSPKSKTS